MAVVPALHADLLAGGALVPGAGRMFVTASFSDQCYNQPEATPKTQAAEVAAGKL